MPRFKRLNKAKGKNGANGNGKTKVLSAELVYNGTNTPRSAYHLGKYYNNHTTDEMVFGLALCGISDKRICEILEVSEVTFVKWKKQHPSLLKAIHEGREQSCAMIARSLYHAALGYSHPDTHITVFKGKVIKTPIIKHYPPNVGAAIFWLCNRQKELWQQTSRHELTGKDGGPIEGRMLHGVDVSSLSDEELKQSKRLGFKLLKASNDNGDRTSPQD